MCLIYGRDTLVCQLLCHFQKILFGARGVVYEALFVAFKEVKLSMWYLSSYVTELTILFAFFIIIEIQFITQMTAFATELVDVAG